MVQRSASWWVKKLAEKLAEKLVKKMGHPWVSSWAVYAVKRSMERCCELVLIESKVAYSNKNGR